MSTPPLLLLTASSDQKGRIAINTYLKRKQKLNHFSIFHGSPTVSSQLELKGEADKHQDKEKLTQIGVANTVASFILADKTASDLSQEDSTNIVAAINLLQMNTNPKFKVYLQTLDPDRLYVVEISVLTRFRAVFENNRRIVPVPLGGFQYRLFSFSISCPGLLPVISNLVLTDKAKPAHLSSWQIEYCMLSDLTESHMR